MFGLLFLTIFVMLTFIPLSVFTENLKTIKKHDFRDAHPKMTAAVTVSMVLSVITVIIGLVILYLSILDDQGIGLLGVFLAVFVLDFFITLLLMLFPWAVFDVYNRILKRKNKDSDDC